MSDLMLHASASIENRHLSNQYSQRIGSYYPSSASVVVNETVRGPCLRALWYRYMNFPVPILPISSLVKMAFGIAWESYQRETFKNHSSHCRLISEQERPDLYRCQYYHPAGFRISGRTDLVLECESHSGTKEIVVVEAKCIGGYSRQKKVFPKSERAEGRPLIEHVLQAALYYYMLRDDLDRVELLYTSRESGEIGSFSIDALPGSEELRINNAPTDILFTDIIRRFESLHTSLTKEQLPVKDYVPNYTVTEIEELYANKIVSRTKYTEYRKGQRVSIGDPICEYCPYIKACLRDASNFS